MTEAARTIGSTTRDLTASTCSIPLITVYWGMAKKRTSFDLSEEAIHLLTILADRMGLNRTGTLEVLVRERADQEGLRERGSPPR